MIIVALAASLALAATGARAACYVEYKAKRDSTLLQLFFDVIQVDGPCTKEDAHAKVAEALSLKGLKLLKIISVTKK